MLPPDLSNRNPKRAPGLFDATLGALSGAVTGGILGLFAVGIYPAIVTGNVKYLFMYPALVGISWLVCASSGWFLGWLVGPRLGRRFNSPKVEIAAGIVAGLVPVTAIILWVALKA